jgi:hypothetical protein
MAKKPSENPTPTQQPVLTFVESDVVRLREFGAFLLSNAKFNLTIQEAVKLNGYVNFMNQLSQKMEAHIMELRSIKEPRDADNIGR